MVGKKRISFLLNTLVKEMNTQADSLVRANYSITYSQFLFLQVLAEAQQLDVTPLSPALGVTKAAASKRLEWFTERQLVFTAHDQQNGKRVLVSLTAHGQSSAQKSGDYLEREFLVAISKTPNVDFSRLNGDAQNLLTHLQNHRGDKPQKLAEGQVAFRPNV
jgi:DNA-binding MarR family transcriptional regulator